MRVISGSARGRKLLSVPGKGTRPILDRIKTSLFDILRPRLQGVTVLDLFAGTGAIGIEALSQGASHCTFLDLSASAIDTIKKNLAATGFEAQAEVRHTDSFSYLRSTRKTFDIIFVAPPQYVGLWVEALHTLAERPSLLSPEGVVVVQIDPREYEVISSSWLSETRQKRHGNTLLVFFERSAPSDEEGAEPR